MSKRELQQARINHIVVRGANWVGDAMMTIPALRELRRILPNAHITLATRKWAEEIFAEADFLDEIMGLNTQQRSPLQLFQEIRRWRKQKFDLAILFPNSFEPALISTAARIPFRVGYATDGRKPLLTHPLPAPDWRTTRHEVFYYLNIIAKLERLLTGTTEIDISSETGPTESLALHVSNERQAEARKILREAGVIFDRPVVALCPGSTNSRAKRWPTTNFAALGDQLISDAGAQVLLIGSPEEIDISQDVADKMRHQPIFLTGRTGLAQTVALLKVIDLLITNDTGPAHIAAAVNLPTVVIFGPTNPVTTRPFSSVAEVVRQPPRCAPCMLRDCPIDHRCMTAISPADVLARAIKIMRADATRLEFAG